MEPRLLRTLRQRPGWERAITVVQERLEERGDEARTAASTYASVYEGRRAAMVVDVITSRQRKYKTRVEPLVATFEQTPAAASLESLASRMSSAELAERRSRHHPAGRHRTRPVWS